MNAIFRYNSAVKNIWILDSTNDSADCNSKNEMMQENRQRYIFLLNLWKMDGLETWTNLFRMFYGDIWGLENIVIQKCVLMISRSVKH